MLRSPSRRRPHRLLVALLLLVTSLGLTASPAAAADVTAEQAFVDALNEIRAAEGLAPLRLDAELTIAAREWTDTMVANADGGAGRSALAHAADLSVGITVYWTKLGENVGYGPDVAVLVDAFVASPSHYRNIVDPDFESIGVGVSYDADGTMWTTHRFMVSEPAPGNSGVTPADPGEPGEPATPASPAAQPEPQPDAEPRDDLDEAPELLAFDDAPADEAAENNDVEAPADEPTPAEPAPERPIVIVAELLDAVGADLADLGI